MLMQPKLELTFQGLPETVLASEAQYLRHNNWNFQNIAKVALKGQFKSNTKKKTPSREETDEWVAINQADNKVTAGGLLTAVETLALF